MSIKWTKSYLFTLRDAPADAEIPSHQLMARAGSHQKSRPRHLHLRKLRAPLAAQV